MNLALLHTEVQKFIKENYKADLPKVVFQGSPFEKVSIQELATQLSGKRKAEKKLPSWFSSEGIIYPSTLNLEQTSSEITARYKASLLSGKKIIDLSGGFGVDSFYFSQKFDKLLHCEIDPRLSQIVSHNSKVLKIPNLKTFTGDGIECLKNSKEEYDWIYVDPSRRNNSGRKIFQLSDSFPNVPENLQLLLEKTQNILLKTSPLLDIQAGISALEAVKEIHVVAVKNEVKELLWVIQKGYSGEKIIKTINFLNSAEQVYEATFGDLADAHFSKPIRFLYEPNAAIMKSGLFNCVSRDFQIKKLHPNTNLYTSADLKSFPGRRFEILEIMSYNKKNIKKKLHFSKANLSTRNFPESVAHLRKIFKLKEGGKHYLFFTSTGENEKILLICKKID